jgi:hypothetical protein
MLMRRKPARSASSSCDQTQSLRGCPMHAPKRSVIRAKRRLGVLASQEHPAPGVPHFGSSLCNRLIPLVLAPVPECPLRGFQGGGASNPVFPR